MSDKINLGDKARDTVTGYVGIVVARTIWLQGCDRPMLQAQGMTSDGKIHDGHSFDEMQCELVEAGAVLSHEARETKRALESLARQKQLDEEQRSRPKRGGPRPEPQRAKDPSR